MRDMKDLVLVKQPINSKVCGQACVAMLLGITLDESIKLIGKKGATNLKHLLPAIKSGGYDWYSQVERLSTVTKMYSLFRQLPILGLLRIRWNKKQSHWVLKRGDRVFDPLFEVQDVYDFNYRITQLKGRITSTFSLIDKDTLTK